MPFENVVCWNRDVVPRIIDTEATETSEDSFLATHHPVTMFRVQGVGAGAARPRITQNELRDELLDPSRQHTHVVVQGTAGSGKSHLIRWLYLTTPSNQNRRVLLIRKSGTNLKRIVECILEGMEGTDFDGYRERLARATDNLTLERARVEFLDRLAVAVSEHGPHSHDPVGDREEREEREELIEYLPALLRDDTYRRAVIGQGGIVDQIAEHVLGNAGRERRESPRRFEVGDIPLDLNSSDLTGNARDFYNQIKFQPEYRAKIVTWINENLSWAILRMLDMSGDDIAQLMLDVRRALAQRGQELVLLIEDFAKLQGIDAQLLESLLVRPGQQGGRLCVLRSAIAVTTGYYAAAPDTVQARTDLVVDLDIPATAEMVAQFASRYLNAVRLPQSRLADWYQRKRAGEDVALEAPNACDECEHRLSCRPAFGARDGHGLYPFTARALNRMFKAYTIGVQNRSGAFNPRDLLNHVVRHTLWHHAVDLRDGSFPSEALLSHFGERRMPAVQRDRLRREVPSQHLGRYETVYELWGDPETLSGVTPEVLAAFGLRPRSAGESDRPGPPEPDVPVPVPPTPGELPPALRAVLKEIDAWANGAELTQSTAQLLRDRLHEAVNAHIDWDAEMLVSSFYVGATEKAFRRTSINFVRQATGRKTPVSVAIPLDGNFTRAALGMEGLLLYEHYGHWAFDSGGAHLRAYLDMLDALSAEVLRQVRRLPTEVEEWDPVAVAVELLTIGARLFGALPPTNATVEQRIEALFTPFAQLALGRESCRTTAWKALVSTFAAKGQRIAEILKSRIACTKGGASSPQVLDAASLLQPIEGTRAGDALVYQVPDAQRQDYAELWQVRSRVERLLQEAIRTERQRLVDWRNRVRQQIGEGTAKQDVTTAVSDMVRSAASAGLLPSSADVQEFTRVVDRYRRSTFEATVDAVSALDEPGDAARTLAALGRLDEDAVEAADKLLSESGKLVAGIQREVNRAMEAPVEGGLDIARIRREIGEQLDWLLCALGELDDADDGSSSEEEEDDAG